jgi:hypothetical protein
MGESIVEVLGSRGEDFGEPKVVWSEVTEGVTRPEGSGPKVLFSKMSGGGIVRVD